MKPIHNSFAYSSWCDGASKDTMSIEINNAGVDDVTMPRHITTLSSHGDG